ncbi:MAG: hypothetical protein ACK5JH_00765 [Anaerocolumna sp.]
MTKFEALKSFTDTEKFSELIFDLMNHYSSSKEFEVMLKEEVTEDGLQTLESIARSDYPLSFDRKQ